MALWRFHIAPAQGGSDPRAREMLQMLVDFGIHSVRSVRSAKLFLVELAESDSIHRDIVERIAAELLTDPVVESCQITRAGEPLPPEQDAVGIEVFFKPGVMDPVAHSTELALADMGIEATSLRTGRRYELRPIPNDTDLSRIRPLVGNAVIEDVLIGESRVKPPTRPRPCEFQLRKIPIRNLDDNDLESLSRHGHLFLSLEEMRAIQTHFHQSERDPTDLELETLAQTWSEHCVHKTLKSAVTYRGAPFARATPPTSGQGPDGDSKGETSEITVRYENLLKDTIVRATDELIREGRGPSCLSVFEDNAGIIGFDDEYGLAFKVETHNHPSAIEPYGGAATGIGGVIRDVLGCGLGAKPVACTDVFCVAPPDWPVDRVPKGIIHPKTVLKGIVAGVRDYGNRMGIPTVNGAVHFDPRYLGNPLVYCGCVGLVPRDRIEKAPQPGDAIVLLGGRTGRDGIHGATFSSAELTSAHKDEFAHAVQIGNPIEEKKVLDIILQARDYPDQQAQSTSRGLKSTSRGMKSTSRGLQPARPLDSEEDSRSSDEPRATSEEPRASARAVIPPAYNPSTPHTPIRTETRCLFSAITDCGAGGLSSAIGEMGARIGAEVDLEKIPLKYAGLRYDEIWISESQERMVLSVPPENVDAFLALGRDEDVEATVIGRFTDTQRLIVRYEGDVVGDMEMAFLHNGLPKPERLAAWQPARKHDNSVAPSLSEPITELKRRLSNPNTASKHWIIRQYDHEVQGGSVVKPLVGQNDGPSDAAVIRPRLDGRRGFALACGMATCFEDDDPYWMAIAAIDEAVRNVVCVGGDPENTAILDNFCWPSADDPRSMGALVRMCQACYDAAKAYGLPFISGKDSLNNVFALNPADAEMLGDVIHQRYSHISGAPPPPGVYKVGAPSPLGVAGGQTQQRRLQNKLAIPYSLLISAISIVEDVNRRITSAPKLIDRQAKLFLIAPNPEKDQPWRPEETARVHPIIAKLIREQIIVAAHDCSDGGIAVAVAEMAIASGLDTELLASGDGFSPFCSPPAAGYIVQAANPESLTAINGAPGFVVRQIARMRRLDTAPMFRFIGNDGFSRPHNDPAASAESVPLSELIAAWKTPLDW